MKLRLPQASAQTTRLELPTIMDRTLAAQHGGPYVQLAAFAIDVDRVFVEDDAEGELPFGWEVFLTETYLVARIDALDDVQRVLLEDTCLAILEQPADEQGYGSQLLFAAHDAVERGLFPEALRAMFKSWRKKPKQLKKSLDAQWRESVNGLVASAEHCLATELTPPLSPLTQSALETMARGEWPLPAPGERAP